MKVGGNWPITNFDLENMYTIFFFQKFVNTINFETFKIENLTNYFYKQKTYIRTVCKMSFNDKT
jgi:hypothetical protein